MFDNLKEKLGSFRDSAEEAAEENVEDVDEADLEEEALEDVESETESDAAEATDTTPDSGADEPAEPAAATVETGTGSEAEPEPETSQSAPDDAAGATAQESATDSTDSDDAASVSETAGDEPAETAAAADGPEGEVAEEVEDEASEEDSGGGLGIGAKARSLFGGSSDDTDTDVDSDADADADADDVESDADVDAEAPDEVQLDTPSSAEPTEPTDDREQQVDEESAVDAAADEEVSDDDAATGRGTGFGAKAKSLVKGKFVIEEEDLEGPLHELEMALLSSDVEMGVAEEILDNIRDELVGETRTFTTSTGEVVEEALHDAIYDVISVGQFDFDERIAVEDKPVTIVFTGVNGVGKTTTIAKLSRYFEERGYSTVMANGDTYRAGANEQIQEHADALATKCISHEQGGDPAAVLYDAVEYAEANDIDIVLGDTAGRLHTDEGLMDQLEKIDRVVGPDMTLFVDEAVAGQDAVNRAREFNDAAEIDGAILTKADADSNGGAAISIAHVTGKPILFLGVGQGYDDVERFDPEQMIDRLLGDE